MKYIFAALLIVSLIFIYLNRVYTGIYSKIGQPSIKSPYTQNTHILGDTSAKTQLKYIALGDSLTAGIGSHDYQSTFPFLLARKFEKNFSPVKLIILAESGAKTEDVLNSQLPKIFPGNPDYITLLVGINDIHNFTSLEKFNQDYSQIITQLITKTRAQIIVINIPLLGSGKLFNPPFKFWFDYKTKQYNKIISRIIKDKPVKYIDLYTKTKQQFWLNSVLYSSDQFHPSEQGYKLWADLINAN